MMAYSQPTKAEICELSEDDRQALSLAFGGIESRIFLGSSFGSNLARLAQLPPRTRKVRRPKPRKDKLAQRADAALAELPAHVQASLLQDEPVLHSEPETQGYIDGVIVARGFKPQTMSVSHKHSVRVTSDLLALEAWACLTNQGDDSDAMKARMARSVLVQLVDGGLSWAVTVLHKMYGGILPALESSTLSFMGELAPLALDVPIVLSWAAKMTAKMRAEATLRCGHPCVRKETVTPRTALENLLSGERRTVREGVIREEALELSSNANRAFLSAKESL